MKKTIFSTEKAPAAIGPYSQATSDGQTLYVSGQLPLDPATGTMPDGLEEQVAQSIKNVIAIVQAAGGKTENILKCGIYIMDMSAFGRINEVYQTFFEENPPARFVVQVSALPKGAQIEIDAVALL
ncbi:MAG: Rid family detoxifying hydrolase [Christensenellaceae bacterium]|jgi:2-iminobutanoate/2-iminopropanoate deaminase|nr:Rid family detoxifying hydrolase [Christensenellaceae bacterium]